MGAVRLLLRESETLVYSFGLAGAKFGIAAFGDREPGDYRPEQVQRPLKLNSQAPSLAYLFICIKH